MNFKNIAFLSALIVLAGCVPPPADTDGESTSSSVASKNAVSSVRSIRETKNVSYTGTVKPAGISIYMEGTHRLALEDGRFILLESDDLDLNGYVGEKVEVFGSIRPTVESDAVIMRVDEISLTDKKSSLASSAESEEESSEQEVESSDATSASTDASAEATASSEESAESTSTAVIEHSAEFEARIDKMASEDFAQQNWSREYCTGHIGFCIPVHKNWYFQSFGATSSDFWHVEMNSQELEKIHDGPIEVRLMPGSLASIGAGDGQVVREGNTTIGYRSWTDGRHFEIIADARLEVAVRYITDNLDVYTQE